MSIIEKSNPLNLQFCVCVVLNASCPLGIIISKTLLKANALVLGIDSRGKDESLNAGLGTHFQYEQKAPEDMASEEVMGLVQDAYGTDRMDVIINIVEAGQEGRANDVVKLTEGLAKVIAGGGRGKGAVIHIMSDLEDAEDSRSKQVTAISQDLASKVGKKGVRCNMVIGATTVGTDRSAYQGAEEHMHALKKTEKLAKDVPSADEVEQPVAKLYDVGNIALFLAGDMGEKIAGAIVARDGSYRPI